MMGQLGTFGDDLLMMSYLVRYLRKSPVINGSGSTGEALKVDVIPGSCYLIAPELLGNGGLLQGSIWHCRAME